jgi:hypothetical protein
VNISRPEQIALEVEPGRLAIERFTNDVGPESAREMLRAFASRMTALSQKLDPEVARLTGAPSVSELSTELAQLRRAIELAQCDVRSQLEKDYREKLGALPFEDRMRLENGVAAAR